MLSSPIPINFSVCVDRYLPGADPALLRDPARRLAALRSKLWPPHQRVLHIRFLNGDPAVHHRIARVAQEWTQHAAVVLLFDDDGAARRGLRVPFGRAGDPAAVIRIGFDPGPSWSYLGTDALDASLGPDMATMHFGWLSPARPEDELRRVVLHEFGHALGLIHEHQHPAATIPWDRDAVYRFYAGPPNYWNRAEVDRNILEHYSQDQVHGSAFDPDSIMLYPIPPELTGGRFSVGWNHHLSNTDRSFIRLLYPPAGE